MPLPTVVAFPHGLVRRQPVKAQLRADVLASVSRSQHELPRLAARNPEAALLVEKFIHKWNHSPAAVSGAAAPASPDADAQARQLAGIDALQVLMLTDPVAAQAVLSRAPARDAAAVASRFDAERHNSLIHCTEAGHRRCAAWLAAHPHRAVGQ